MPALITTLINGQDNYEIVRDQIAAILVVELAEQQVLAAAASLDPEPWKLRVFTERSNPWADFTGHADVPPFAGKRRPIVNVSIDRGSYDMARSNVVERQRVSATYNVDCYGLGVSSETQSGHDPGDARASMEAQRAYSLVRKILMAGTYTYLGLRGVVGRRWLRDFTVFDPQLEDRAAQRVVGVRAALEVELNEFSPQVQGQPLELITAQVFRKENGELLLRTDTSFEAEES